MDENVLNIQIRSFLKNVGITSQREIEASIRNGLKEGLLKGGETLKTQVKLKIEDINLETEINGTIRLE